MAWLDTVLRRAAPAPPRRPKRALLAWEFGGGRTHVSHILGVLRHLRAAGVECLATLYETHTDSEFAALGTSVVQNYVWPSWRRYQERLIHTPADTNLADFLANLGFADPKAIQSMLAHYDGLFRHFEPDIVLAENAFGALLAARGRVPVIAFGSAAMLPPIEGDGFARYPAHRQDPGWESEVLLDRINEGLALGGRLPIERVSDILGGIPVCAFGLPALDMFAARRAEPLLPPNLLADPAELRAGDGDEVFVYLQGFSQQLPPILPALLSLRRPVHAYMPDLMPHARDTLLDGGVHLTDGPIPLPVLFERARCFVHHGAPTSTATCLAAGIPQVIVARELDNRVCGDFLKAEGLGEAGWLWDVTTSWIVDAVRRVCEDEALRARCRARAPEFRTCFGADPTAIVAAKAIGIVGAA